MGILFQVRESLILTARFCDVDTNHILSKMTSPYPNFSTPLTFANTSVQSPTVPSTPTPAGRGRPRGSGTGAKRGRKPKNALGTNSPRVASPAPGSSTASPAFSTPQYQHVHWATNPTGDDTEGSLLQGGISRRNSAQSQVIGAEQGGDTTGVAGMDGQTLVGGIAGSMPPPPVGARPLGVGPDEEGDVDDELLPAMADDDYSAQQSWNTQSKDNLKYAPCLCNGKRHANGWLFLRILMDSFTPEQYERFEAYRRHALPKQAVRKVSMGGRYTVRRPLKVVVTSGDTTKPGPASFPACCPDHCWLL